MPSSYIVGKCEVRPDERRVLAGGKPAPLGSRAFDLLICLIERRDRVVTKTELMKLVWPDLVVEENNLTVHVSALRKLLGAQAIATVPGRGYRFAMEVHESGPGTLAAPGETDLPLPDKPSIAVLPFANMSADPEQEFFSDGISEDIITGLSRSPWLFVIARSSSFTYRGLAVEANRVCRELGVRYVLEGSVRRAGNRVRITVQLIDGVAGDHLFAETYDGNSEEIFAFQDDITRKVIATTTTQILVTMDSSSQRLRRPDVRTWELVMHGQKLLYELTKDSLARAIEVFRRAAASEPKSCEAHYGLAGAMFHYVWMGFAKETDAMISEAYNLVMRALALDERNEYAHWTAGLIELWRQHHDLSVAQFERAIELNPNCSLAYGSLGTALGFYGRSDEAIRNGEFAIRINPRDPSIFFRFSWIALAHYLADRYVEAATWAQRAVSRKSNWYFGHLVLAASLGQLGRSGEARGALDGVFQTMPGATISSATRLPFKNMKDAEHLRDGLRKAGLGD